MKVPLPAATSTLSVNYIFVLIAASICDLPQSLIVATGCFIAQSFLRAKVRPHWVHVFFRPDTWAAGSSPWRENQSRNPMIPTAPGALVSRPT
jgi:hypothetical protein